MTDHGRAPLASGDPAPASCPASDRAEDRILARLGSRSVVLVGLMGAGKSTLGRRLASALRLPFRDADQAIEEAAGMTIADIFAAHGEGYFRDGERRVIARLLQEGPRVIATGGGAFMNPETRARIAESAVSIWLRADLDVLMRRVRKRATRPLLQNADPEGVMRKLMEERHPVYALADVVVESREVAQDRVVGDVVQALESWLSRWESPA